MLLAGGGADYFSADGGAFMFGMDYPPSGAWWSVGSANKCSLLVRVLAALLPRVVLFRLMWVFLHRMRGGATVPHINPIK